MDKKVGLSNQRQNGLIAAVIIALAIVGMFFYGQQQYPTSQTLGKTFTVTGNGVGLQYAFDGDEKTAWVGEEGNYGQFYYTVIDFGQAIDLKNLKMLLGADGQKTNYYVNVQTSVNGNIWTDIIGATETGSFTKDTYFKFDFMSHKARYMKVGIKMSGTAFQKVKVYEIEVNKN